MMLVTYRAEGELRDVAIHIFGNLVPEKLPAFSSEGYWKSQLPDNFFKMGQSVLSTLGARSSSSPALTLRSDSENSWKPC